jgi:hypothetical protein
MTHSHWYTEEVFTDINAVLQLLRAESPTYEPNHIERNRGGDCEWQIVVPWYTQGDSGGDRSGYHYFQIDPDLVKQLIADGLVQKRTDPRIGYTYTYDNEFVVSQAGRDQSRRFESEMQAKAERMLKPGVHTDLTGKPERRGSGRDHWRFGKYYLIFELPGGNYCKVYPEEDRLVLPEQDKPEAA